MASALSRVTDFVPATPILSGEVDAEFNQIVNLLNATSTNIKATLKISDAGDPPLELNQLSTGPILKGFQGGVEQFRVRNNGGLWTPGIYDTNDNEQLLFSLTASAVNEFTIKNATTGNPPELRVTGGDANIPLKLVPKGSGVVKIQSGLPVAAEDAANKAYVDARVTWWSMNWFIADPSTFPTSSFNLAQKVKIPFTNFTASGMTVMYNTGTASGSFQVSVRKHPFNNQPSQTVLGTINTNPGAVGNEIFSDIADHAFTIGDYVYPILDSVSSPLQRDVSISLFGFQVLV